ncbi:Protein phosphatase 2A regulatory B subunit (B56 family) [Phytophthora infestans]|uniref:Protein phosphatase 2A regulatory B subunit (B56 family) n=2 Tax=Phytophthora infestans TaxID=4787 RepID=A0A833T467_PHYIN|nr:Protein phosphatase 2A regulatory B subunit (B56 family) [Phytophthora infestans]
MAQRGDKGEKSGFFRKMYSSIGSSSRQLASNRHEKAQRSDSTSSGTSSGYNQSSPSDGATTGSGHSGGGGGLQNFVKHHSFNGHMPFSRDDPRATASDPHQSLLSKRPSLIVPFSNQQLSNGAAASPTEGVQSYLDDFQAPISKSGVLIKQANHFKTWKKRLMVLKGHSLFYYVSGTSGEDSYPRGVIPLQGVRITPIDSARFKRQNCFEICHPGYRPIYLMAKSEADLSVWMSSLTSAAMPTTADRKMLLVTEPLETLFNTPALEDAVPYKRTFYFRQKVAFCMLRKEDSGYTAVELFDLNEKRLTTLCDLNSYCDSFPMILDDPQLFVELLHVVGCYIFRPFPRLQSTSPGNIFVEEPSAEEVGMLENPMDKYSEYTTEEQQWGLLSACYDLLLKAIEHIDKLEKHVRKEFFPLRFIAQLVNLFKTPSFKERQVLKGVLHRLYYKLTQRRSAIRKEIANTFYEYIYETSNHYGVAELLEILGSIVNGFACPIKQEHVVLLEKALIPLHSTPAFISYHQQLAYCMIQYVSKDHTLFTPIVRGLIKFWPVGNSFKEVIFIVEFEEMLEHVLAESDFDLISPKLARRLGQCMVSDQFQVAERAISCWSSPSCLRIMNEYEKLGQGMFDVIKPFLQRAVTGHWNTLIQQKAQETYTMYYNMGYDSDDVATTSSALASDGKVLDGSAKTEESDPDEEANNSSEANLSMAVRLSASNVVESLDVVLSDEEDDDEKQDAS